MRRRTPRQIVGLAGVLAAAAAALAVGRETGLGDAVSHGRSLAELGRALAATAQVAVSESYLRSPEMILGVSAAIALPALGLVSCLVRWLAREREGRRRSQLAERTRRPGALMTSPLARAWLEIKGQGSGRRDLELRDELVRIGSDGDSDLALAERGVHSLHAIIQRTAEAEFIIFDVSSGAGSGILVNGRRLASCRLHNGDRIELGAASVTFHRSLELAPGPQVELSTLTH